MILSERETHEICRSEKTLAYYSGWGGVEIKKVINGVDDYVVYVSGAWGGAEEYGYPKYCGCAKVEYDGNGNAFFRANRHVIPLDECVRC